MKLIKNILPLLFVICCYASQAQVAIPNEDNIDPSAELNVHSQTKGVLIPCLTTNEQTCIKSPATSLWIFNTDKTEFTYFSGGSWQSFNSAETIESKNTNTPTEGEIFLNEAEDILWFYNGTTMKKFNLTEITLP